MQLDKNFLLTVAVMIDDQKIFGSIRLKLNLPNASKNPRNGHIAYTKKILNVARNHIITPKLDKKICTNKLEQKKQNWAMKINFYDLKGKNKNYVL